MTFGQELHQPEQRVQTVARHTDVAHLARSLHQGTIRSSSQSRFKVCPFLELPEGGDGVLHKLPQTVTELHIVNLQHTLED